MTMNCDYGSVVSVILPVENKILTIVHLKLKLTKTHPLFKTFWQKHSGCVFASGKNGSTQCAGALLPFSLTVWLKFELNEYILSIPSHNENAHFVLQYFLFYVRVKLVIN